MGLNSDRASSFESWPLEKKSHKRRINHTFLQCAETYRAPVSGRKPWISTQQRSFERRHNAKLAEGTRVEKKSGCGISDKSKGIWKVCIFEPTEGAVFGGDTNKQAHAHPATAQMSSALLLMSLFFFLLLHREKQTHNRSGRLCIEAPTHGGVC